MEGGNWNSMAWVGKHNILVNISFSYGYRSQWLVVDLKKEMIVTRHPQVVWSDKIFKSTAVLHEEEEEKKGTLSVLNIGRVEASLFHEHDFPIPPVNQKEEYIHPSDTTCIISTLDLTKSPPIWSHWTPGPKNITYIPFCATLDNNKKIFAFLRSRFYSIINPAAHDDDNNNNNWEEITIPYATPDIPPQLSIQPISDPKKNRFIAYFDGFGSSPNPYFDNKEDNSLYAYYPNRDNNKNEQWELLHQNLSQGYMFDGVVADQVVGDNLILCFDPDYQSFTAYNISSNKWLEVDCLYNFHDPCRKYFAPRSNLVHLGNDILCLACSFILYPDHKSVIHFLRFCVKHRVEDERVQLTCLSFHAIFIDDIDCIADTFIPF